VFGKSETKISSGKANIGLASVETKTTVEVEKSTTRSMNLGNYLDNSSGHNTPSAPAIKIKNEAKASTKMVNEGKVKIRGVTIKAKNQTVSSVLDGSENSTQNNEVFIGVDTKGSSASSSAGVYVSEKNGNVELGLKATVSSPTVPKTSTKFTAGIKVSTNIHEKENE